MAVTQVSESGPELFQLVLLLHEAEEGWHKDGPMVRAGEETVRQLLVSPDLLRHLSRLQTDGESESTWRQETPLY